MIKKIEIKETTIDRAVSYFAPVWGASRRRARVAMAISGAYHGASKKRRHTETWTLPGGDADADTLADLDTLRDRSRDLLRNTPIATGAIGTNCRHVIGLGLKVQSRIDRNILGLGEEEAEEWQRNTEREFNTWAGSLDCSINRQSNFYDLQNLVFRSRLESGDVFVLLPFKIRKTSPYGLKLQIMEADRVSNPHNTQDKSDLTAGIQMEDDGTPTGYHVQSTHPGSDINRTGGKWDMIPAFTPSGRRNIIHSFRPLRPGQTRGVPYLAPVIEHLHQLGKYTTAELMATVVSSYFTVFLKSPSGVGLSPMQPTDESGGKASDKDYRLTQGGIVELAEGEEMSFANPGRPNPAFDAFVQSILRQIGVGLGLPFELLIMHFTKSFSAARSAMLNAWKMFSTERDFEINHFSNIIYEALVEEAVLRGRIIAPGFDDPILRYAWLGNIWIGPAPGQIDPTKEVQAAQMRVDGKFSTLAEETAGLTGTDWDQKIDRLKREKEILKELGNGVGGAAASIPASEPAQEGTDNDDTNVDDTNEGVDGRDEVPADS